MNTPAINRYKHYRFPAEIISHGVWLYVRFCLSNRDVEELLFARGVRVTYEAIRKWCRKFGQTYANLEYPRIVYTDLDGSWLLGAFDTLLKIAQLFSSAVVIASS